MWWFAARKFLENLVITGTIFSAWAIYFGWQSYLIFGLIVALYLTHKQLKKFTLGLPAYSVVFLTDLIFWPAQIWVESNASS